MAQGQRGGEKGSRREQVYSWLSLGRRSCKVSMCSVYACVSAQKCAPLFALLYPCCSKFTPRTIIRLVTAILEAGRLGRKR